MTKLLRFCAAVALVCVFAAPASALSRYSDGATEMIVAQATPAPPPAAATTQNTVTTTGPVSSETKISVGTIAGEVLTWIAAAFSAPIGGLLVLWLYRLFKFAGIQATDALRARLQEIVVNGLNAGATAVSERLRGKGQVEVKNAVVASAVLYAQDHGAETIKALGLDPKSGAAIEAIKARIETAIADPIMPTPAVLDAGAVPATASKK